MKTKSRSTDRLSNTHRQKIDVVKALSDQITQAVEAEDWENIDTLIKNRNRAADQAFTASLPETVHDYARQAFEDIRKQDEDLLAQAKEIQSRSGAQLAKAKKNKQSIQSYLNK